MDPTLCYLTVLTSQNAAAGTYEIPKSRATQLANQCGMFRSLFSQYIAQPGSAPPTLQIPLPSAQTFDILLHWFYHHDTGAVHAAIAHAARDANSPTDVLFGIVRNAAHVAVDGPWGDALWDVLAAWCAQNWVRGGLLRECAKWTWTVVPVTLAARSAIAVGGGGVGGDMMAKWASGDAAVAEKAVMEVKRVLALYRAPAPAAAAPPAQRDFYDDADDDDARTEFDPEEEDLGGFAVYTPSESTSSLNTLNSVTAKKKRKGLLAKFKNLLIEEENVLVATVVVVRDANGRIVDEQVMRH
ncbi:hypothetical protein BDZ88DRAFT_503245 [Geranomyces variabilis]|nr:hypothetical protein BDZ88DRAFT_503245 [Geranomyces variabilis]KAJ3143029.1 hypothetical protein HDU90_002903 [Geranomyces variabilis]